MRTIEHDEAGQAYRDDFLDKIVPDTFPLVLGKGAPSKLDGMF